MIGDTDAPLFTPESVRCIIATAKPKGLREIADDEWAEFADRLNRAAFDYNAEAYMQQGPSPSARRKMFKGVETAADALLSQFNVSAPEHVRDGMSLIRVAPRGLLAGAIAAHAAEERGKGFDTVAAVLRDVRRLRTWAKWARQRVEPEVGQDPPRKADTAKHNLFWTVLWVWMDIIQDYPDGISKRVDGSATGPFIRFALRVFQVVPGLENTTAGSIGGMYDRLFRVKGTCSN